MRMDTIRVTKISRPAALIILSLLLWNAKLARSQAIDELYRAAKKGDSAKVTELLARGVSPNGWKQERQLALSPIGIAVKENHIDVAKTLLKAGADVNATTEQGPPALFWAAWHCRPELAQVLIEAGANVNLADPEERQSPIYIAAALHCESVLSILIKAGADINQRTKDGATALMTASARGHDSLVSLLLDAGADPAVRDKTGRRALDYAERDHASKIISLLKLYGAYGPGRSLQATNSDSVSSESLVDTQLTLLDECPSQLDVFRYNGTDDAFKCKISLPTLQSMLDYETSVATVRSAVKLLHSRCHTAQLVPRVILFVTGPGYELPDNPAGLAVYRRGMGLTAETGQTENLLFYNYVYATHMRKEFHERNSISKTPSLAELASNPFNLQGEVVGVAATFVTMETEDIGRFSGQGGEILVTGAPKNLFTTGGKVFYLAGKVQGKSSPPSSTERLSTLTFVDSYECKQKDCGELMSRFEAAQR